MASSSGSAVSNTGKIAYIYDESTDTWYPVAGATNTSADFAWSGTHSFAAATTFTAVATAKAGINNFESPAVRDSAIPSPINGIVVFVRTDSTGVINQIQYYYNGAWRPYNDTTPLDSKTSSFTLSASDVGKTIFVDGATAITVTIPTHATTPFLIGTQFAFIQDNLGQIQFAGADGTVTINSKNSAKKTSVRYSPATLIKKADNVWYLFGDLVV